MIQGTVEDALCKCAGTCTYDYVHGVTVRHLTKVLQDAVFYVHVSVGRHDEVWVGGDACGEDGLEGETAEGDILDAGDFDTIEGFKTGVEIVCVIGSKGVMS